MNLKEFKNLKTEELELMMYRHLAKAITQIMDYSIIELKERDKKIEYLERELKYENKSRRRTCNKKDIKTSGEERTTN